MPKIKRRTFFSFLAGLPFMSGLAVKPKPSDQTAEVEKQFNEVFKPHRPPHLDEAAYDLYRCCLNALGAYGAVKALKADHLFPGYESSFRDLQAAIAKADGKKPV